MSDAVTAPSASHSPAPLNSPAPRASEVDLLRFLAAFAVVLFHYAFRGYAADGLSSLPYPMLAPVAKYGYLGVNLFFMISGFVIMMTASRGSLKKFVASRIARLYPAYWVACALTFAALLTIGAGRFPTSFTTFLINLTMLQSYVGVASLDGAYWSLAVELRFYCIVAAVLALGVIRRAEVLLIVWLIVTCVLDLVPVGLLRNYLITEYAPFFIAGASCFYIWSQGPSLQRALTIGAAWTLALLHVNDRISYQDVHYITAFNPVVLALVTTASFAVMVLVALRKTGWLARQSWMLLGSLTYPLYLIHQMIGYMVFNLLYESVNPHLLFWSVTLAMVGLAWLITVQLEQRYARQFKALLSRSLDRCTAEPRLVPRN